MNRQDHELAEHHPWLRRLARRLARSATRADDLVQDTYVTALRNAPPDVQLRPWLRAVMRKLAWGQVRSEQRRALREDSFSRTAPSMTLPDDLHDVDGEQLSAALASLPEPFHSTIVQRFLHGRSCADIARSERIPAGTVRWRQARALELLRAELAPPRRRFVIWAVPFLGAGERLVARVWQALAARLGGSKLLWLALAVAVVYAITGSTPRELAQSDAATDQREGLALDFGSPSLALAAGHVAGAARPHLAGDAGHAEVTRDAAREPVTRIEAPETDADMALTSFVGPIESHQSDCAWDPVHGRRCVETAAPAADDDTCARLRRQMLASTGILLGSPAARQLVTAAMMANRTLAQRLGCSWARHAGGAGPGKSGDASKPVIDDKPGPSEPPAPPPPTAEPPTCVTEAYDNGVTCTACPGQAPECVVPPCHTRTIADGIVCNICPNELGYNTTDCPAVSPAGCVSEIASSGLVCSTCEDQPGPPECLPAECTSIEDNCLRCVDPKGRVAVDCSGLRDSASYDNASLGMNNFNSYFGVCNFGWGPTAPFEMTCHYPGPQSCIAREYPDWHCLDCLYRDSTGGSLCMDGSEALPDPMADRPHGLPAPGTCTTERASDGTVTCATCTRADLSATTACYYNEAMTCESDYWFISGDRTCMSCERLDGSPIAMCVSVSGIAPAAVTAPAPDG